MESETAFVHDHLKRDSDDIFTLSSSRRRKNLQLQVTGGEGEAVFGSGTLKVYNETCRALSCKRDVICDGGFLQDGCAWSAQTYTVIPNAARLFVCRLNYQHNIWISQVLCAARPRQWNPKCVGMAMPVDLCCERGVIDLCLKSW